MVIWELLAVTTCNSATKALAMLRENRNYFDLVISDVYMPDMDGFKLLEAIGLELDLPVIMMSGDGETDSVMKGIRHGACDYLLKPVRLEELKNIWQHVVRKLVTPRDIPKEESGEWDEFAKQPLDAGDYDATSRKRKDRLEDESQLLDDVNNLKKARVVWSAELHQQFVNAVDYLGVDKAVPRKILDIMNVQGLTRENVASHLQKYRLYLKRLIGVTPKPYPVASFQASENGPFGGTMQIQPGGRPAASSSTKGLNLGGGAAMSAIGLNRGTPQIDAATLNTLVQLQSLQRQQQEQQQQKQATSGGRGGLAAELVNPQTSVDPILLQRMDSYDLDLLMKAQHDVSRQQRGGGSGGDELAALLNGSKDALPYLNTLRGQGDLNNMRAQGDLNNLRGQGDLNNIRGQGDLNNMRRQGDLKPTPMGSTNPLSCSEPMTAMSMSNLRGVDDVGPSLQSMESARSLLANKLGADFSTTSAFSSSTTTRSNGGAAVSDGSFSTSYGEIGDVPPDFLVASPSDLSLLGQLQAFDQGEVDYGQSPHPQRSVSYS
ncbi:hypothetical protein M758_3G244200 [Ceratodon purpureus]|nr:hypothetical protein M758_3G244200 [Ceratodon purpureus]